MISKRDLIVVENINKIVNSLKIQNKFIVELSKELNLKRSTLNYYLQLMEAKSMIQRKTIEKGITGKPTKISLTDSFRKKQKTEEKEVTKYIIEILGNLNKNKGEMKQDDFLSLIPFDPDNIDSDRYNAPLKLLWLYPKLVEQYIKITPEGEKFLKNSSKT